MNNPYLGVEAGKPSHWCWVCLHVVAVILSIPLALTGIGGILIAGVIWFVVMELVPDEIRHATTYNPKAIARTREYESKLKDDLERFEADSHRKFLEMCAKQDARERRKRGLTAEVTDQPVWREERVVDLAPDRALEAAVAAVSAVLSAAGLKLPTASAAARAGRKRVAEDIAVAVLDRVWTEDCVDLVPLAGKAVNEALVAKGLALPTASAADRADSARVTQSLARAVLGCLPAESADEGPSPSTTVEV